MIPAICLNASNRPEEIQISEWINVGAQYHIIHVYHHPLQGVHGCELNEIRLTEKSYPYEAYKLSRFGVTKEGMEALIQMMKDCSEIDNVDVYKLLKESELQVINP